MTGQRAPVVYRALLRLLPPELRAGFGRDMEELFAARLAAAKGPAGRLRVWLAGCWDLVRHGVAERWAAAGSRLGRGPGRGHGSGAGRNSGGGRDSGQGPGSERGRDSGPGRRSARRLDSALGDVRLGVRMLARAPGFSAVACLTLALGIGATTAVFAAVHALLLRPLPYADPEELVLVWPGQGWNIGMLARVAEAVPALEGLSGISNWTLTLYAAGADPEEVTVLFVSWNHFDVLGVRPLHGRSFRPEEGQPGGGDVAILSHEFWQSRYGGDPGIIGRRIRLAEANHATRTVIGIMPPRYEAVEDDPVAWVPIEATAPGLALAENYTWWVNWRVGRLRDGATREQVEAQLARIAAELRAEVPHMIDEESARAPTAPPLRDSLIAPHRPPLAVLSGAVVLVLLIACVNVANLLLARGEMRGREVALRRALGASRLRILRQLLTESLILALAGGLLGALLGAALLAVIVARAPASMPDLANVSAGGAVLAFALGTAVLSALLFGGLPAVRIGRSSEAALARQGRGAIGQRGAEGVSAALIVLEISLAVVLVIGSALMVRTLDRLHRVDPGFAHEGVLALRANPPAARYSTPATAGAFYDEALDRIRALPNVASAGGVQILPVTQQNWSFPLFVEGHVLASEASPPSHNFRVVTSDYFETLRIPLLRGRAIDARDHATAMRAVVVNRAFAELYWPGQDPIGRHIRAFAATASPMTVVGVVSDVRQAALDIPSQPELYVPYVQVAWPVGALYFVVRAADGNTAAIAPAVRNVMRTLDADVVVSSMEPLSDVVGRSAEATRFMTLLLLWFGLAALLLGAIGVYGVTAVGVARRLPEFGVRLALGATRRDVLRSALGRGVLPVAAGILLGTIGALAATRLLRSLLFEVSPTDPATFAAVAGLLAAVGLGALLSPAWRAARTDPAAVLRRE